VVEGVEGVEVFCHPEQSEGSGISSTSSTSSTPSTSSTLNRRKTTPFHVENTWVLISAKNIFMSKSMA